jgi:putative transposase
MSGHTTLPEIAEATPRTKRAIEQRAKKERWPYTEHKVLGGRQYHYPLATLPADIRQAVLAHRAARLESMVQDTISKMAPAPIPTNSAAVVRSEKSPAVLPPAGTLARADSGAGFSLTDEQREAGDARAVVLRALETLKSETRCTQEAAIETLLGQARAGALHADLAGYLQQARTTQGRKGADGGRWPSARTLKRWLSQQKHGGMLAPRKTREKDQSIPDWGPLFLVHYRQPTRPPKTEAWKKTLEHLRASGWGEHQLPAIDAMYLWTRRLPVTVLERGRATGTAWKKLRPFIRRDWSGIQSMEVWTGDGHTFKAKVQHPDHGRPFAPEVTLVVDCPSRMVMGWAISLSENCLAVSEALSHGMAKHGKPLVYYSDNGSGQTAKLIDSPVTGLLARMGVDHQTGIPGNPNGRGLIERIWRTITIPLAREFATCQTATMDAETLRKRTVAINKALTKGEVPSFVPSWKQFIDAVEIAIHEYNTTHLHRELKGLTPEQHFNAHKMSLELIELTEDERIGLYRPEVIRTPQRGEITVFTNRYYLSALSELPAGTRVRVAFDVQDAGQVWVKDLEGRLLGIAAWEGNSRDAFPKPYIDELKENRVAGIVKRAQAKIDTAEAELGRTLDVDGEPVKTIADFLPKDEEQPPEKEIGLLDLLPPEEEAQEPEPTYLDTMMGLWAAQEKGHQDDEEGAAR